MQLAQSQRCDGSPLISRPADRAPHQGNAQDSVLLVGHEPSLPRGARRRPVEAGRVSTGSVVGLDPTSARSPRSRRTSGARPRRCAIAFGDSSASSAFSVARTTLTGLLLPSDLVSTSLIPAASTTARTPPPAITPVPGAAGFSNTREAPNDVSIGCGIVVPSSGTRISDFLAASTPLRIESGTSLALPSPAPTLPLPSPTTTIEPKLKRRPPRWTLATRLI